MDYIKLKKYVELAKNPTSIISTEEVVFVRNFTVEIQKDKNKVAEFLKLYAMNDEELNKYIAEKNSVANGLGISDKKLANDEQEKVEFFYKYPEKLSELPPEESNKYSKLVADYEKKQEAENKLQMEKKPKTYILEKKEMKAGYVDALVLALITGFFGGLITMISLMMIQR